MQLLDDMDHSTFKGSPDHSIDARGLMCPAPVLELKSGIAAIQSGQVIEISADDPHARLDFQVFCARTGHHWIALHEDDQGFRVLIRKR